MSLWEAIVLGVVQGLTEFLPISSTAHLVIVRRLLGHGEANDAFTTAIQLGTLVAVVAYFWRDLLRLSRAGLADLKAMRLASNPDSRLLWMMIVATFPVGVCGLAFRKHIKDHLYGAPTMAAAAIGFSALLLLAELVARRRPGRPEESVTWFDAIFIGLFQAFALIPGASRSGVTITAGLFAGLSRGAAARVSFLLSLPAILAAGLYEAYKDRADLFATEAGVTNLLVGGAVAAVVGYASIAWLIAFLKRFSTYGFIVYRVVLGIGLYAAWSQGVLR